MPQLTEYLDRHPADLAISVFATGASAISAIAARYPALKHVVFCRDATPHRLWVHPHVDMYLVTSHVAECAVRRFQPEARVRIVPPPVRAAFRALPSQAAARDMFGVPGERPVVLLMSGGWGLGPVAATAAALADAGIQVLAVAGRNDRMEATLRAAAVQRPRIRAFGYTNRVPELMAAADLVITSPGDTCAEARAVGRRLLLLDVLPGHGRDNCQHQLERGNAWVTSAGRDDVVRTALAALAAPEPEPHRVRRPRTARPARRACCATGTRPSPPYWPSWVSALRRPLSGRPLSGRPLSGRPLLAARSSGRPLDGRPLLTGRSLAACSAVHLRRPLSGPPARWPPARWRPVLLPAFRQPHEPARSGDLRRGTAVEGQNS